MITISSKDVITEVLLILKEKKISATKIFLHKFIYFLTLTNYVRVFKFEPYTYGPFSFNLAKEIDSMIFWDEVKDINNTIEFIKQDGIRRNPEIAKDIQSSLDIFLKIIKNNFAFDNLERVGTALYCMEVLHNQKSDTTLPNVTEEFKGWKGNKYTEEEIKETFESIFPHLPAALQR